MAAYTWFTVRTTSWRYVLSYVTIQDYNLTRLSRTRFRREANSADNKAATVAMDSLINYEAVKACVFRCNAPTLALSSMT